MLTLDAALNAFLTACRAEGLSPRTVRWYSDIIHQYAAATPDAWPLTLPALRTYLAGLADRELTHRPGKKISPATIRGHARALKRFANWLHTEAILPTNPAARLRLPKQPRRTPRGIELTDLQTMLDIAPVRERALLYLLIDTGCRAAEICGLKPSAVDLQHGCAHVIGKGNKERTVYLSAPTVKALQLWLRVRPTDRGETIFVGTRGPLQPGGLLQALRRLAHTAGVTGRCNPHSFRHAHAREYLLNGGDLASLSALLGHEDIQTTQVYTCFTNGELHRQHQKYSPGNGLKIPEDPEEKEETLNV